MVRDGITSVTEDVLESAGSNRYSLKMLTGTYM